LKYDDAPRDAGLFLCIKQRACNMTLRVCAKAPKVLALTLVAIVSSAAAAADQALDIKGKWTGKTYTIVAGRRPLADEQGHVRQAWAV
jgi:hypothetical protein